MIEWFIFFSLLCLAKFVCTHTYMHAQTKAQRQSVIHFKKEAVSDRPDGKDTKIILCPLKMLREPTIAEHTPHEALSLNAIIYVPLPFLKNIFCKFQRSLHKISYQKRKYFPSVICKILQSKKKFRLKLYENKLNSGTDRLTRICTQQIKLYIRSYCAF